MDTTETVYTPRRLCSEHTYDELVVYCQDCLKAVCIQCSKGEHSSHNCEALSKFARQIRLRIPETCANIRRGPLSKMKDDLDRVQTAQITNTEVLHIECQQLAELEDECVEAIRSVFEQKRRRREEDVKRCNDLLHDNEAGLLVKINETETIADRLEKSLFNYRDIEVVESDKELKELTESYTTKDIKPYLMRKVTYGSLRHSRRKELLDNVQDIISGKADFQRPGHNGLVAVCNAEESSIEDRKSTEKASKEQQPSRPGKPYSLTVSGFLRLKTPEYIDILVYEGSVLQVNTECIVSVTNENLSNSAGLSRVISDAAGPKLATECQEYLSKYGRLSVGSCCSTVAGELSCKMIIHVVGPKWSDRDGQMCRVLLHRAIQACFLEANRNGLRSIAMPAVSAGVFGVPKQICAEEHCTAIMNYSKSNPFSCLREVHFVDKDKSIVSAMQSQFILRLKISERN